MKTNVTRYKYDIANNRFGKLTAISYLHKGLWNCTCDCGSKTIQQSSAMREGRVVSCGCYGKTLGHLNATHGMSLTKEYKVWQQMKKRCLDKKDKSFSNYGGRGISVCEKWINSFECFISDIGGRPNGMSLDRIDVNGNYEPSNCRWASMKTQARNKTNNQIITFNGVSACLSEWEEITGIKHGTIRRRIKNGWSIEDALSVNVDRKAHQKKLIEHNGLKLSLTEWAEKISISKITLKTRLNRGWSLDRALNYV
jgi:hypothetical protein